ncbi:MAG: F0F1 ATP synthase subunit gamma [Firmicutes bacterium]|nr:F0F1 ATP synthase subunit gamma [Bacillota bacterium]MCL1954096.1 F0F1 ATP synthase subunit gamma [Bacillota bacterium]
METNNAQAQKTKQRIKALQDTIKITKALDSISLVKMRKATSTLKKNKVYFDRIQESVQDMVNYTKDNLNPYLVQKQNGKHVFLVIAGDKGFCGAYNHTLCKYTLDILSKYNPEDIILYCVGYKLIEFCERNNLAFIKDFVYSSNINSNIDAQAIAIQMHSLYISGEISTINIIYTQLQGGTLSKPYMIQALPIIPTKPSQIATNQQIIEDEEFFKDVVYEPSIEKVLDSLIDQYLNGIIFGALVHSQVAEHTSRCMAMGNATDNAQEILEKVKSRRNQG